MASASSTNIVVGVDGKVYVAPLSTTVPTDVTTAWAAGWIDLGYLNDDGVQPEPSMDVNEIRAWQNFYAVRRVVRSRDLTIGLTFKQFDKDAFKLAMGGGSFATAGGIATYTPPSPSAIDERMLGIEWQDGAYTFRMVIRRGMVTDLASWQIVRDDSIELPITFGIIGEAGVDPFTVKSNHPGWL